jgi:catechol 2,3-dioxygenase-like lactoylglutathione lyase family enzyme
MFDRVTIRVSDLEESTRFYSIVLGGEPARYDLALAPTEAGKPVTRHLHVAFAAPSREAVDAFWRRGVDAGYRSDGEPGLRPLYRPDYYGGFLLDPDGNSVESVHRPGRTETGPPIDHLWIGVSDLEESRRFWETLGPLLGLRIEPARFESMVAVAGKRRHLMLVADGRPPTEHLHVAFVVPEDASAGEFRDPEGNAVEAVHRDG